MICSIPTVKSGSTWLDRLRSTKGFPTADGLDLGHFLLSNNNNNQNSNPESDSNPNPDANSPESTESDDKRAVVDNRKQNSTGRNGGFAAEGGGGGGEGESEWFGIMSNVLADLFNMNNGGEVDRRRRKKSLRKQRNPRICLVPTAAAAAVAVEEEEERSSGGCERKDENALAENNNVVDCEEEEEEKEEEESGGGERELLGFSRNEVTVIDTSCMEWKFEKLVYRKRNVWKVREKKGKSKFVGRKRRKGGVGSEEGKKKMKVSNENGGGGGGGGGVLPLKNGQGPRDDKSGEVGKGPSDDLSQLPQKRASLSRLRKKTKTGSSSVVLTKGSPASNKTKSHKSHGSHPEFEQRESGSNKPLLATFLKGKESGNGR